ncbi:MAG: hypothetical protein HRT57_10970 [Crocinitomicaceae bacterium]|nr:hypothetical protein [Crocinitomicaceae bacterium]
MNYGIDPPAIGIVALDNSMNSCIVGSAGSSTAEYWNTMNGLEPSGTPIMHTDGYPTKYRCSDDLNDPSRWSQYALSSPSGELPRINDISSWPI